MILCVTLSCPFQTKESQAVGDLTTVTCNAPIPFHPPPPLDLAVCPVAPDPCHALVPQAPAMAVGPGARCDGRLLGAEEALIPAPAAAAATPALMQLQRLQAAALLACWSPPPASKHCTLQHAQCPTSSGQLEKNKRLASQL